MTNPTEVEKLLYVKIQNVDRNNINPIDIKTKIK